MNVYEHPWVLAALAFGLGYFLRGFVLRPATPAYMGPRPTSDDVDARIREGSLIEAIKAYRHMTNDGLKEAKIAVERRAAQLNVKLR